MVSHHKHNIHNLEEYTILTQSTLVKQCHYRIRTKIVTDTMSQFNSKIVTTHIVTNNHLHKNINR